MDIAIDKTSENPFLQRKEVHGKVTFTGATPSQKQLADSLATKLSAKSDAIFVQHIYSSFGAQQAKFEAHVYPSKELLDKVVRLGKKAKEKLAGKAPEAGAAPVAAPAAVAAEAPKAEAKPAEAKKEAKPAEKAAEAKKEAAEPAAEVKKEEHKKEAKPAEVKKEEPKKEAAKA